MTHHFTQWFDIMTATVCAVISTQLAIITELIKPFIVIQEGVNIYGVLGVHLAVLNPIKIIKFSQYGIFFILCDFVCMYCES